MRRKSLYTAIGRFERRTNRHGQAYPVILLGGNEYMADLQEMALWTSLNWRIARNEEIASLYEKTISRSGFSAERPLEACIQRLLMRGLIVCSTVIRIGRMGCPGASAMLWRSMPLHGTEGHGSGLQCRMWHSPVLSGQGLLCPASTRP